MNRDQGYLCRILVIILFVAGFSPMVCGQFPSGNGSGFFLLPTVIEVGDSPLEMVVGDLDLDGNPDLIVGTDSADGVQVLIGTGDGQFDPNTITSTMIPEQLEEMFLGHFDSDGFLDLIYISSGTGNFYLLRGDGSGALLAAELIYQYVDPVIGTTMADLTGDGYGDFVLSSICGITGCVNTRLLLCDGDGGLDLSVQEFPVSSSSACADIDGDGDLDLAIAGADYALLETYLNDGAGAFSLSTVTNTGEALVKLLVADVMSMDDDGNPDSVLDGVIDIIALPEFTEALQFFPGDAAGGFGGPYSGYSDGEISSVGELYFAQLDGALAPELIMYTYGPDMMTVFLGGGTNGFPFGDLATYPLLSNPSCLVIADFNLDTVLDVVVSSYSDDSVSVYLGEEASARFIRGDMNFDNVVNIADPVGLLNLLFNNPGPLTGCLDVFDFNDDGDVDISDSVYLLQYLFTGGSAPPAPFPSCGIDATPDTLDCLVPVNPSCP
ncbi:MAG: FG-GAP-like repeat-containing protein [Planctomycetota bacterium]